MERANETDGRDCSVRDEPPVPPDCVHGVAEIADEAEIQLARDIEDPMGALLGT